MCFIFHNKVALTPFETSLSLVLVLCPSQRELSLASLCVRFVNSCTRPSGPPLSRLFPKPSASRAPNPSSWPWRVLCWYRFLCVFVHSKCSAWNPGCGLSIQLTPPSMETADIINEDRDDLLSYSWFWCPNSLLALLTLNYRTKILFPSFPSLLHFQTKFELLRVKKDQLQEKNNSVQMWMSSVALTSFHTWRSIAETGGETENTLDVGRPTFLVWFSGSDFWLAERRSKISLKKTVSQWAPWLEDDRDHSRVFSMVGGECQAFSQIIERNKHLLFPDKRWGKCWTKLKFIRNCIIRMKGK